MIQFPAWDVRYLNYPLEIQINKIRWIIKIALNYVAIFSYLKSGLRKKNYCENPSWCIIIFYQRRKKKVLWILRPNYKPLKLVWLERFLRVCFDWACSPLSKLLIQIREYLIHSLLDFFLLLLLLVQQLILFLSYRRWKWGVKLNCRKCQQLLELFECVDFFLWTSK